MRPRTSSLKPLVQCRYMYDLGKVIEREGRHVGRLGVEALSTGSCELISLWIAWEVSTRVFLCEKDMSLDRLAPERLGQR